MKKVFNVNSLNKEQKRLLQGFFAHCRGVAKHNEKPMFDLWADILDKALIGWNLQNGVSYLANQDGNLYLNFNELKKFDR